MRKSELTRLSFQPVRRIVLEKLKKFIKSNPEEMPPVEQVSNQEFDSPLSKFLRDS